MGSVLEYFGQWMVDAETADALSMTYLAAHAAHKRVVDRLAREGEHRLVELGRRE